MKTSLRVSAVAAGFLLGAGAIFTGCGGNDCGAGTVEQDGECVVEDTGSGTTCGAGTRLEGGECVPVSTVTCASGTMLMGDTCVAAVTCGTDTAEEGGACVPQGTVCADGTVFDPGTGKCVTALADSCGTGTSDNSGTCEPAASVCGTGTTLAADGRCIIPARAQIIHNAAGVADVDIYVVPAGEDIPAGAAPFAELAFRAATAFVTLPAIEAYDVYVAADGETSPQSNATITGGFTLTPNSTTRIVATDGGDAAPSLLLVAGVEAANTAGQVALQVLHGSSDAPAVDIFANTISSGVGGPFAVTTGVGIVNGAEYRDATGVAEVGPADYVVTLALDGDGDDSYDPADLIEVSALLEDAADASVFVMASGLVADSSFAAVAVFTDGTTAVLPAAAQLQAIHNAADPGADPVDLLVNGNLIEDLAFREATPTVTVPAQLDVEVRAPDGTVDLAAGAYDDLDLTPGVRTVAVASGVLTPGDFAANPDGQAIAFALYPAEVPADSAEAANVDLYVFHGSTDTPNVDVTLDGGTPVFATGVTYGSFAGPVAVTPALQGDLNLDIVVNAPGGTSTVNLDAIPDLTAFAGESLVVVASGFLDDGAANQNGEALGFFAFDASGGTGINLDP